MKLIKKSALIIGMYRAILVVGLLTVQLLETEFTKTVSMEML